MGGVTPRGHRNRRAIPLSVVFAAVEAQFGLPEEYLVSPREARAGDRTARTARRIAMLLLRKLCRLSVWYVGEYFSIHGTTVGEITKAAARALTLSSKTFDPVFRQQYEDTFELSLAIVKQRAIEKAKASYKRPEGAVLAFAKRKRHIVVGSKALCSMRFRRIPSGLDLTSLPRHPFTPDIGPRLNVGTLEPLLLSEQGVEPMRLCTECARAFDLFIHKAIRTGN